MVLNFLSLLTRCFISIKSFFFFRFKIPSEAAIKYYPLVLGSLIYGVFILDSLDYISMSGERTGEFLQHMLSFLRKAHDLYIRQRVLLWRNPSKCNTLQFPLKKFLLYSDIFQRYAATLPELSHMLVYFCNNFQERTLTQIYMNKEVGRKL